MANSLLDFVMSLVRDPDAAAHYAADPAQAIADAHLTDVTSADVNNLIPVVAESMPGAAAGGHPGGDVLAADPADNVWASGAATAAFDAFGDHFGGQATEPAVAHPVIDTGSGGVIEQPDQIVQSGLDVLHDAGVAAEPVVHDPAAQFDSPVVDPGGDWTFDSFGVDQAGHHHPVDDHPLDDGGQGFDLFT